MASTPADMKEMPSYYAFVIDMPRVRFKEINVQVEDDNLLVINVKKKRDLKDEQKEKEKEAATVAGGVRYLRMERRMGKFMKKFALLENADVNEITAKCKNGVLMVTVMKKPLLEPKKLKTIQVNVA